jgi:glutamate racemase
VLEALAQHLPHERFVYVGDTHYMPYGSQPLPVIAQRAATLIRWLQKAHGVKALVVACNTSAAVLGDQLPRLLPQGMPCVDPIGELCTVLLTSATPYQHVGLLATPGTVASGRHQHVLSQQALALGLPPPQLTPIACDGLAKLVEIGAFSPQSPQYPDCVALLQQTLPPDLLASLDGLILGCTHYPHAQDVIETVVAQHHKPSLPLINPAQAMAQALGAQLAKATLLASPQASVHPHQFYVTQQPRLFFKATHTLPLRHVRVEAVNPLVLL